MIHADNIVSFEFVRYCAIARAGNHGGQRIALLHEVLGANRVEEALANGDVAELDTEAGRVSSH